MMTVPDPADPFRQTARLRERFACERSDGEARAELKAIWGDAINAHGVLLGSAVETVYDRDGCRVEIRIATVYGRFAFGSSFRTPTEGYGGAPSVWEEWFGTHAEARTAAIEFVLGRLPRAVDPPEEDRVERMRRAVAELSRQPSLF